MAAPGEPTQKEIELAGPFPETCVINQQRVHGPWISLKEGWWYCDACSRYAAPTHQSYDPHLTKVLTWLESRDWSCNGWTGSSVSAEDREAIWKSVVLHPWYRVDPADDAGANGDEGKKKPQKKKLRLKPREACEADQEPWPPYHGAQASGGAQHQNVGE